MPSSTLGLVAMLVLVLGVGGLAAAAAPGGAPPNPALEKHKQGLVHAQPRADIASGGQESPIRRESGAGGASTGGTGSPASLADYQAQCSRLLEQTREASEHCPAGWTGYWHQATLECFLFVSSKLTFSDAAGFCASVLDGTPTITNINTSALASVHSLEENLLVSCLAPLRTSGRREPTWLGGYRHPQSKHFAYLDGTCMVACDESAGAVIGCGGDLPAGYWLPGEPNNDTPRDELCLQQGVQEDSGGSNAAVLWAWNDARCDLQRAFVCKTHVDLGSTGGEGTPCVRGSAIVIDVELAEAGGDMGDNALGVEIVGNWVRRYTSPCSGCVFQGAYWVHDDGRNHDGEVKEAKSITFRATLEHPGTYAVDMAYIATSSRATNTPVSILVGGEEVLFVHVNQQVPPSGADGYQVGWWLGDRYFAIPSREAVLLRPSIRPLTPIPGDTLS